MKADGHRRHAESLERAIALASPDPTTSVAIIENAWGAAYHWISYGCIQRYQQHRDKHQGLTAYLVGLGEQRLAQWWRNFEDIRQAGFYGNQAGESEVQEALDLLGRIRMWATTWKGEFMKMVPIPVWLDDATAALVEETVSLLIKRHADILLAVILFGSIARHEERPPDDACPSDVDLLAIFDTTDRLVRPYREDIFATIIDACALHLDAPREVNVLLSDRTMQTWDSMFLDNLARDGMLLYARGSLPSPLAARLSLQGVLEDKGVKL